MTVLLVCILCVMATVIMLSLLYESASTKRGAVLSTCKQPRWLSWLNSKEINISKQGKLVRFYQDNATESEKLDIKKHILADGCITKSLYQKYEPRMNEVVTINRGQVLIDIMDGKRPEPKNFLSDSGKFTIDNSQHPGRMNELSHVSL